MSPRRPVSVTIFAVLVLFLTAWNGIRLYAAITSWSLLVQLNAQPGPAYMIISALAWVFLGFLLLRGTWLGRDWARRAGWWYVLFYIIFFWMDRLFFRPMELSQDILIVIVLQLTALGLTAWALLAPVSRSYFR